MSEIQELVILVVVCVAGFTALYKILPFKVYGASKPKLSLFPKYIATFSKPTEQIERALQDLGFEKVKSGAYSRGKVYGDFSAKTIKLSVQIYEKEKQIKVFASFFGILFDTGDIWQVTTDILNG